MKIKKSVVIPTVLCAAVAGVSSYVTFNEDSPVFRSYFINEYAVAKADSHEQVLKKDAVLSAKSIQHVTANATDVDELLVQVGDEVLAGQELLSFESDASEREFERLEIQAEAYEDELDALQSVANSIGSASNSTTNRPTGNLNLTEVGENISVDVALQVASSNSPLEAAAIIDQRMIEVQRNLDMVDGYLAMSDGSNAALLSPIDATVTAITHDNGFISIELYANEQRYVTFVSDTEWQRLETGQAASVEANIEDETIENEVTGMVASKHKVPATDSPEYALMQQLDAYKDRTLYEVSIETDMPIDSLPFGSFANASIVLDEEPFAYKLPIAWIAPPPVTEDTALEEAVDAVEDTDAVTSEETVTIDPLADDSLAYFGEDNVYTLGYDGRVRLNPIDVSFTIGDAAVTPTDLVDGTIMLNATERDIYAETFMTMPTRKLQWEQVKMLSWEDYVKYLLF